MKFEDFLLRAAQKVQAKYQNEVYAQNNQSWHEIYAAQQRLAAATLLVQAIKDTINEGIGDTD